MTQKTIQIKLLRQINNLEDALYKIENQLRCLKHDFAYRRISRLSFDARKHQLDKAKEHLLGSINFLEEFYKTAKRIESDEFVRT